MEEATLNFSMAEQNSKSVTATIRQFGNKLFDFVRGKVKTNEDAEDILQEIWYQLSSLTDFSELENVSAWLYRIARNKVIDRYRKKSNDLLDDYAYETEEGEFNYKELLLADDSNNPELTYFKETFWKELMMALDELPENQKEVFILNEMEDLTLQEIAEKKGENLKTIISRKGYAVKFLRKKLDHLYKELNY